MILTVGIDQMKLQHTYFLKNNYDTKNKLEIKNQIRN